MLTAPCSYRQGAVNMIFLLVDKIFETPSILFSQINTVILSFLSHSMGQPRDKSGIPETVFFCVLSALSLVIL